MGMGRLVLLGFALIVGTVNAAAWMDDQASRSKAYLLDNIAPPGAAKGSVVASPSRQNPDYFYHWIRDAALVMDAIVTSYLKEADSGEKALHEQRLKDYVRFSRQNQTTANPSDYEVSGGMGEPKFEADGTAYQRGWGRPQNDGPAICAITLIRLANHWLDKGRDPEVRGTLYDGKVPTHSVIKADLEFVAHHWNETCYDIWEEISGYHFYTRLIQRRALVEGAKLADRLGDGGAASFYRAQAAKLEPLIETHWNESKGVLVPTFGRDRGVHYKTSDIDTAVLLAILHSTGSDGYFSVDDDRVLSTLERQIRVFQALYHVNQKGYGATAMGRYPEDLYDGNGSSQGNPWFLTTLAVAEMHYRIANRLEARGQFNRSLRNGPFLDSLGQSSIHHFRGADLANLIAKTRARGDAFLGRACFHGVKDGRFAEQIHRDTGFMQGANDLTWSYASFLTAYWQR